MEKMAEGAAVVLPGFTAERSLYIARNHYRSIAPPDLAQGTARPAGVSANGLGSFGFGFGLTSTDVPRLFVGGPECYRACLASIPCADDSCRRQRSNSCSDKCGVCPLGSAPCGNKCCPPGLQCCGFFGGQPECKTSCIN
jgi:hypothetical protein